ncbi:2-hydroxyhepta-2,4-diene-1,7-dioate isomerase [bacterium]|nr:2-hydroxyhepta-2,4-diene-1,7-dioate isomerase [bacterium]
MSSAVYPPFVKFRPLDRSESRWGFLIDDGRKIGACDPFLTLDHVLTAENPAQYLAELATSTVVELPVESVRILAPIDSQEVWGSGVTYHRSKIARQEESKSGGSFYDLVYTAERPELFFKATQFRTVGPNGSIRVRNDSNWCVPEPELTLVLSNKLEIIGVTIGDDVSARDIEGENPLYLPQAKVHDGCCALGPAIVPLAALPEKHATKITVEIVRDGATLVHESTSLDQMKREFTELAHWLGRDATFPTGVLLMTGTGIVPPDDFSLIAGDLVHISISGIGKLTNSVVKG